MRWVTAGHTVLGSSGEKPTGSREEAGKRNMAPAG